jgi:CRP-like cAMP-binding protein
MPSPKVTARMKRDALASCPFFQPMSPEDLDAMVAQSGERRVARGTVIFQKGDDGQSLMAVLAGQVRVGSTSPEGKAMTLRVIGPGEIFGEIALLDGKPRSADAVAIVDTTLMVLERRTFLPLLMANEDMLGRLLGVLCARLRETTLAMEEIAMADLAERLARRLGRLAQEYGRPAPGGGVRIGAKFSDRELANLVASTRESVNKQISAWRKAGILTRDGGYLVILNEGRLQRVLG